MRVDAATFRPGRAGRGLLVTAAPPPGTTERARTGMNRASCRGERPASATRPKLGLLRNVRGVPPILHEPDAPGKSGIWPASVPLASPATTAPGRVTVPLSGPPCSSHSGSSVSAWTCRGRRRVKSRRFVGVSGGDQAVRYRQRSTAAELGAQDLIRPRGQVSLTRVQHAEELRQGGGLRLVRELALQQGQCLGRLVVAEVIDETVQPFPGRHVLSVKTEP